jgi:hypothetical protein
MLPGTAPALAGIAKLRASAATMKASGERYL